MKIIKEHPNSKGTGTVFDITLGINELKVIRDLCHEAYLKTPKTFEAMSLRRRLNTIVRVCDQYFITKNLQNETSECEKGEHSKVFIPNNGTFCRTCGKILKRLGAQPLTEGEGEHELGSHFDCKECLKIHTLSFMNQPQQESKEEPEIDGGVSVKKFKSGGWCITGFDNEMASSVIRALSDIYIQKKEPSKKPSERIGEIYISKGYTEDTFKKMTDWNDSIIDYLDELYDEGKIVGCQNCGHNFKV